mgnify:CR=1 FL=1
MREVKALLRPVRVLTKAWANLSATNKEQSAAIGAILAFIPNCDGMLVRAPAKEPR